MDLPPHINKNGLSKFLAANRKV